MLTGLDGGIVFFSFRGVVSRGCCKKESREWKMFEQIEDINEHLKILKYWRISEFLFFFFFGKN